MALTCAVNADLKEEWENYLGQTKTHVQVLGEVCRVMNIDAKRDAPGRRVVRTIGAGLLEGMKIAKSAGDPKAAETVACEAVVLAETKDHLDWELLGRRARARRSKTKKTSTSITPRVVPGDLAGVARPQAHLAAARGAQTREDRHLRGASRTSGR